MSVRRLPVRFLLPRTAICTSRSKPTSSPWTSKPARTNSIRSTTLSLWVRVDPEAETDWRQFQHIHSDGDGNFVVQERVFAGESIPDGFGGVLAAWIHIDPHSKPGEPLHTEARLTRISPTGQRDFTLPMTLWAKGINSFFDENMILAEGNPLYATNGTFLVRFDTEAGEVNWVRSPPTGSIKLDHSTRGGGLIVVNAGRLHYLDAQGNGADFPWTVAVSNPEDIGLVQSDPFDGTPRPALQLRDVQLTWSGVTLLAVEDAPLMDAALSLCSLPASARS